MKKWGVWLALLCCLFLVDIHEAQAAPNLYVEAEIGIDNKGKYNTGIPLTLTVTNNGSDFNGDLVVNISPVSHLSNARAMAFDIASGETKTLNLYLDGVPDNYGYSSNLPQMFYFYEGDWKEGKSIKFEGDKNVSPLFVDASTYFIFTLTQQADRLKELQQLNQQNNVSVEIVHLNDLKNFTFPTDVKGLQMANAIIIDETSIADLDNAQQEALLNWVRQGGSVLFGANPQGDAAAGVLQPYLPMTLTTENFEVSAAALAPYSGGDFADKPLVIQYGQLNEGAKSTLTTEGQILIAEKAVGSGKIIQTSFSLGDEPIASMDGYAKFIDAALNLTHSQMNTTYQKSSGLYNSQVLDINKLFPSFEVSAINIVIIILLYVIIIGPVLYLVLKRADRREQAWWIIPTIAILVSVAIFVISAKDRIMQPQMQQASVYKINEDGSASGYYGQALLSNRAGDFVFEADKNTTMTFAGANSINASQQSAVLEEDVSTSTLTLRDMDYWSTQGITGTTQIQDMGSFKSDLKLENNKITGTVENTFEFEVKDVELLTGIHRYNVGTFAPGETKEVSIEAKSKLLTVPYANPSAYYDVQRANEIAKYRLESLKDFAIQSAQDDRKPVLIGWSDVSVVPLTLAGNSQQDTINVVSQAVDITQINKEPFTLTSEEMQVVVGDAGNGSGWYSQVDPAKHIYYMDPGTYTATYMLPNADDAVKWQEITLPVIPKNMQLKIYNFNTTENEVLEEKLTITTPADYISPDGYITIELDIKQSAEYVLPKISVKGEPTK